MTDQSPLVATNPDSLTELFDADPLTLNEADLMRMVIEFRRRRSLFASEEAAKALAPKRTKAQPSAPTNPATLDRPLTELGLDDLI